MKKRKIIHIAGPSSALQRQRHIKQDSDDYIMWAWYKPVALNTIKLTNKYDIECWRPEPDIKKIIARKIDGVTFKVFPCFRLKGVGVISPTMLKLLKKEAENNKILIDIHNLHDNIQTYLISLFFRDIPIVAHHHGCYPPMFAFKITKNPLYLLVYIIDKIALKYVDHFSVISKVEKDFLCDIYSTKVVLEQARVDFDKWKPMDKTKVREKLNIPTEKKVIIYIGKYDKLKGIDVILKTYKELKKSYDVELILIGGSPDDPLYDKAKSSGAQVYGFVPQSDLPLYYSAADIYLLPSFDKTVVLYGGFGTAPIEALACNIPLVTSQLIHFPNDKWVKIGKIPKDREDVIKCVSEIFDDPSPYKNCREVAKKYYDIKKITINLIKVYDRLFREYYE